MLKAFQTNATDDELGRIVDREVQLLAKHAPEILEELKGISTSSGVAGEDLAVAALVRTVGLQSAIGSVPVTIDDCLCLVAGGTATTTGELFLAKNGDFITAVSEPDDMFILEVHPEHGMPFVGVGAYPEKPAQPEGMNASGLCVVGAGQYPKDGATALERGSETGVCLYHRLGQIYEGCSTIEEALRVLEDAPRGYTGRTMILGEVSGRWVKVEVSYQHLRVAYPEPEAEYPTNYVAGGVSGRFSSPDMHALVTSRTMRPAAYLRYDRLMQALIERAGRIDLGTVMALLREHHNDKGLASICKHIDHPNDANVPSLEALPTWESVIFEPRRRRGWVLKGHPCESEFLSFEIPRPCTC